MPEKHAVEQMFDNIAPEYDALNHLLSLDIDKWWRHLAVRQAADRHKSQNILDVACGTGDFSIALARYARKSSVIGVDLSEGMMQKGREKVMKAGLSGSIRMIKGDCEALEFADSSFDAVCAGFGVRNFEHLEQGLMEMLRVLRPGGKLVILELSVPRTPVLKFLYKIYFTKILPSIGGHYSGNKSAYKYLPASVLRFPLPKEFKEILRSCGYSDIRHRALTFGICRLYTAVKPKYDKY